MTSSWDLPPLRLDEEWQKNITMDTETMRTLIEKYAYYNPLAHAVRDVSMWLGMNTLDQMTLLAFHALVMLEKDRKILEKMLMSSNRTMMILSPDSPEKEKKP